MRSFIRRFPVLSYFIAALVFTWGVILAVTLPSGMPGTDTSKAALFGWVAAAMAFGPPLASLLITAMLGGGAGLKQLLARQLKWRGDLLSYAAALLLVPACALAVLAVLLLVSPDYTPGIFSASGGWTLLVTGIIGGLLAGGLEEIGWTGFALPRLQSFLPTALAGIVLGSVHAIWHLPAGYWGEGAAYGLWYLPYFLACWLGGLIGLRILISWLYQRTGSLPLAQLAHASYTGGLLVLWPPAASPLESVTWTAIFVVLLLALASLLVVYTPSETGALSPAQ
jgi:membrane protease YdiL (CAAX protease family)